MKKFLALAMALCLSVTCLAGCTNDKDPDASQTPGSSVEQPVDDEQQQTETETLDVRTMSRTMSLLLSMAARSSPSRILTLLWMTAMFRMRLMPVI